MVILLNDENFIFALEKKLLLSTEWPPTPDQFTVTLVERESDNCIDLESKEEVDRFFAALRDANIDETRLLYNRDDTLVWLKTEKTKFVIMKEILKRVDIDSYEMTRGVEKMFISQSTAFKIKACAWKVMKHFQQQ